MNNKYIKSLGGEDEEEVLGSKGRIVSTEEMPKDEWQTSLRPQRLDDYIGQEAFKKNLKVYIAAAKSRKEALDHVLLYGPPGLGKTTMAKIIANELGSQFKVTSGHNPRGEAPSTFPSEPSHHRRVKRGRLAAPFYNAFL